jgi:hypothetical protein
MGVRGRKHAQHAPATAAAAQGAPRQAAGSPPTHPPRNPRQPPRTRMHARAHSPPLVALGSHHAHESTREHTQAHKTHLALQGVVLGDELHTTRVARGCCLAPEEVLGEAACSVSRRHRCVACGVAGGHTGRQQARKMRRSVRKRAAATPKPSAAAPLTKTGRTQQQRHARMLAAPTRLRAASCCEGRTCRCRRSRSCDVRRQRYVTCGAFGATGRGSGQAAAAAAAVSAPTTHTHTHTHGSARG